MKYSDIIALPNYFRSFYDLQDEGLDYWKQFVPTRQFNDLLKTALDAVSSNIPDKKKSIWIKGTYGTGKSHASAVVKHLLCSDLSETADYIEDRILLAELKSRLLSFRRNKLFFPVVLKGTEDGKIYDMRSFLLTLERIVKESLRKAGKTITVKSDFERAVEYLETTPIDINAIIAGEPELRSYAKSKDDIIKKLRTSDTDVYLALEEALAQPQYSVHFTSSDIVKWLSEVEKEIVENRIADGLLIIWDEFTSVMDTITSGMTNMVQNIAELTGNQNIYLYLISHKNSSAYTDEDIRKMEDRFHKIQYDMEVLTTYRIMAASIRKLDEQQYDSCRSNRMDKHAGLISYLTENDNQQASRDIRDLFPFHPYSAFLCSSIANQIGSANRTVMKFLNDENGFKGFIEDKNTFKKLLTADMLWDYFLEEFLKDVEKYAIVTQTYYDRNKAVEGLGLPYEKVFKGILLLNAMTRMVENREQRMPSTKNIKYMFEGEDFEHLLDEILDYFDTNQIIQHDPSGNFLIAFASLPQNEINAAIKRAESSYSDSIKIIGYDERQNRDSVKDLLENSLIRQPAFAFLSCAYDNLLLRSYIKTAFKEPYTINVALLFAMDIAEKQKMQETLRGLTANDDYKNVIFVLFDEVFENNGRQKSRLYYYVATADVARNHNSREQQQVNDKNAKDIINQWILGIKHGTATIYFRQGQETKNSGNLAKYINDNIVQQIFSNGVETLLPLRKSPMTFWETFKNPSPASIEPMLVATNREDAEQRFKSRYTSAKFLFKDDNDDYVVDANLNLKPEAPNNHPLVQTQKKVDEILENIKRNNRSTFNLGAELQPLTQPPFGLYTNIPNMAVLAFALRKCVNELNGVDLGTPIDSNNMRDKVVEIFNYWQKGGSNNKLSVRFGSKEEKDLKDLLIGIFDMQRLSDVPELTSLKNVRWGVIAYCKQKSKLPLWCLKYSDSVTTANFRLLIDQLVELVQKDELKEDNVKKVLKALDRQQQFELSRVLLNTAVFEEGFISFVHNIKDVKIKDDWWNELKEYLNQQMQGEVGFWKESDVETAVLRFSIKKNEKDEVKSVTISPNTANIEKGQTQSFYATVEITGNANKEISWVMEGSNSSSIDSFGVLKVSADEPSTVITVKAISQFDSSKVGIATVKIISAVSNEKVNKARTKVVNAGNTSSITLKNILLQILEKFPQTADIIDENLE
ncbi:MAG: Ig-like domain-containing protein [Bacteroidales bacterium]|jgi:hypothetical protein|nr:Ig-like domain-containing protein [Bacteroidales bacterium]